MATDSSQIIIPGNLTLWLGAVGTVAPTDATSTPGSGWSDAGYTTEDGSAFATAPEFVDVFAHQSSVAVRTFKTRDTANLQVAMLQWNTATFEAAFGGGAVTVTGGVAKFTPPAGTVNSPTAVMADWIDGTNHFRLVVPKARVRSGVTLQLNRTQATTLPVTFAVEATSGTLAAWYVYSDDVTAFTAG